MTTQAIAEALGGRTVLKRQINTASQLMQLTRDGLPATALDTLAEDLSLPRSVVAQTLGISQRTLSRRAVNAARLTAEESDRAVRMARVFAIARETLGGKDRAAHWLQTPNRALEGDTPFARLDTSTGVHAVEEVLGRIAYGVYS